MNVGALKGVVKDLPEAKILVERNGLFFKATGFVVRENKKGEPVIVIKQTEKGTPL